MSSGLNTPQRPDDSPYGHDAPPDSGDMLALLAKSAWQAVLVAGLVALALGCMVLAWPEATLTVVGILFGLYLLVTGVLQLVAAFGTHTSTALRVLAFVSGVLCVLLGLLCFRSALDSVLLLALWIGIGWLFRGITHTVAAISDPDMPARGWQIFAGVISLVAGVVLMVWPLHSVTVLTVLTGCWLFAVGIVEVFTALRIRHHLKSVG